MFSKLTLVVLVCVLATAQCGILLHDHLNQIIDFYERADKNNFAATYEMELNDLKSSKIDDPIIKGHVSMYKRSDQLMVNEKRMEDGIYSDLIFYELDKDFVYMHNKTSQSCSKIKRHPKYSSHNFYKKALIENFKSMSIKYLSHYQLVELSDDSSSIVFLPDEDLLRPASFERHSNQLKVQITFKDLKFTSSFPENAFILPELCRIAPLSSDFQFI